MSKTPRMDAAIESPMRASALKDAVDCGRSLELELAALQAIVKTEVGLIRAIVAGQGKPLQDAHLDTIANTLDAALKGDRA